MDRDELLYLIEQSPVRLRMNNGDVWDIPRQIQRSLATYTRLS